MYKSTAEYVKMDCEESDTINNNIQNTLKKEIK